MGDDFSYLGTRSLMIISFGLFSYYLFDGGTSLIDFFYYGNSSVEIGGLGGRVLIAANFLLN